MSPVKIEKPSTDFSALLEAVKEDPAAVAAGIKARVTDAMSGSEVVMMGGWTN
ncbi:MULTISPECIES: hypothetical protein [Streptomyces]|uniref:Uncharacterized protein n=1 Tax=Streptomyces yunnanensis TaxID=156453 RepID=A0A9X8N7T3_9ACTN|nr:hypothetical protein [Streptomyces yunnanensis]SHN24066.1 hypothetical protein SAMN05216268_12662 [Streptomyces yunnanensis]